MLCCWLARQWHSKDIIKRCFTFPFIITSTCGHCKRTRLPNKGRTGRMSAPRVWQRKVHTVCMELQASIRRTNRRSPGPWCRCTSRSWPFSRPAAAAVGRRRSPRSPSLSSQPQTGGWHATPQCRLGNCLLRPASRRRMPSPRQPCTTSCCAVMVPAAAAAETASCSRASARRGLKAPRRRPRMMRRFARRGPWHRPRGTKPRPSLASSSFRRSCCS